MNKQANSGVSPAKSAQDIPEVMECVMAGLSYQNNEPFTRKQTELLERLRREKLTRPAIFVGTGTCGLGAGAGKTLKKIRDYLESNAIAADVVEVGCIGLCSAEPIVDLQVPGKTRVSFCSVTQEKVEELLSAVFAGDIPADQVLGQHRQFGLEAWQDVPYLDEHPFFAPQTRWVLANCGIIDPASIDEYIARGGYKSLAMALQNITAPDLCDIVEKSGLRGRGGGGFLTGKKWRFASQTPGDQKYLICNADEGDPGAFMDRAVIEGDPHRLLEGMALAAYAIAGSASRTKKSRGPFSGNVVLYDTCSLQANRRLQIPADPRF